ncbi:MAG: helix-turn-helix domain-containing protein [Pirellulales bacterium]|nr:helix-turn-helix domain-containing protein [Pirellulales bacterium]
MNATPSQVRDPQLHLARINAVDCEKLAVDAVDLAELIAVSPATIERWCKRGVIPHAKIGKCRMFPVAVIKDWLAKLAQEQCPAIFSPNADGHRNDPVAATL